MHQNIRDSSDNNDDFQTMMMVMMPDGHGSYRSLLIMLVLAVRRSGVLISFYEFTFRELDHKSVARSTDRRVTAEEEINFYECFTRGLA